MGNLIYLTIEGKQQGLISRWCGTIDSIGNKCQEGKEDEIIIIEYSSTITRNQNVSHHPIEFIKNIDKSSPLLLVAISNNEVLKLTFDFYRTSQHGKNEKYYTIVLNQASIVDYSTRYPHSIDSGLPTAGEFLDMITPQYVADLMSWGAIGARTTESQVHRELSSGLSCPVGFKNGTDGTIKVAIDAINAAGSPHCFLSVTKWGHSAIVRTAGNGDCHIILRGGKEPNYSAEHVAAVKEGLKKAGLPQNVMVDFSHANSCKKFEKQMEVGADICQQISSGEKALIGVMIESHLVEGSQSLESSEPLVYGKSITDACIGWDDTEILLRQLADAVVARRG